MPQLLTDFVGIRTVGFAGSQGSPGNTGFTGSQGATGFTGSAGTGTSLNATNDTTTTTLYPVMVGAAGSAQTVKATTTKLSFNASTGALTVAGNLTLSGTSTSLFINADPATGTGLRVHHNNTNGYQDTDGIMYWRDGAGSVNRLTLDTSSNLTATGNVTAFSDIRLKENIEIITDALNKIKQIKGITYTRKDLADGARHAGVIAQEVEAVLPEVVTATEDGTKTVAYGNLTSLLIEAVKELSQKVDNLQQEINMLKRGN
jgi:hypothetical protein